VKLVKKEKPVFKVKLALKVKKEIPVLKV